MLLEWNWVVFEGGTSYNLYHVHIIPLFKKRVKNANIRRREVILILISHLYPRENYFIRIF